MHPLSAHARLHVHTLIDCCLWWAEHSCCNKLSTQLLSKLRS